MIVSKSWLLTISSFIGAFILPLFNEWLAKYGITITESEVTQFLGLFVASGSIGAGMAVHKRQVAKAKASAPQITLHTGNNDSATNSSTNVIVESPAEEYAPHNMHPELPDDKLSTSLTKRAGTATKDVSGQVAAYITPPPLGPAGAEFQTNLQKINGVASIAPSQNYLWLKIPQAKNALTAQLFSKPTGEYHDQGGNLIRAKQSHLKDEDNNVTTTRIYLAASNGKRLAPGWYRVVYRTNPGTGDPGSLINNSSFRIL